MGQPSLTGYFAQTVKQLATQEPDNKRSVPSVVSLRQSECLEKDNCPPSTFCLAVLSASYFFQTQQDDRFNDPMDTSFQVKASER